MMKHYGIFFLQKMNKKCTNKKDGQLGLINFSLLNNIRFKWRYSEQNKHCVEQRIFYSNYITDY